VKAVAKGRTFLAVALSDSFASHAAEPAIAGFEVGMDATAIERVLETSKATNVRRTKLGH
jgi:hypothetical protein